MHHHKSIWKLGGMVLCVLCCAHVLLFVVMAGMPPNLRSPSETLAETSTNVASPAVATAIPVINTPLGFFRYTGDAMNATFSELLTQYTAKELHENQFLTIAATFWYIKAMQLADPALLASQADAIADFVMKCYNPALRRFIENRPYAGVSEGASLVRIHSTPLNTHLMGIWILGELKQLTQRIDTATIAQWKTDISQALNADGGFGEIFPTNSSIVESYYATHALLALFGGNPTSFPAVRNSLISYLVSRSRTPAWGSSFGVGGFSEYTVDYNIFGWEDYLVDYFAAEIYRLLQVNASAYIQNQLAYFLANSKVYSTKYNLFYGQHNDFVFETAQNAKTYYGAPIMLNLIKNLNVSHGYNLPLVLNNFEQAWNQSMGLYMLTNKSTGQFDLPYQALTAQMLETYGLFPGNRKAALATGLQRYYAGGGASFENTADYSLHTAHQIGGIANNSAAIIDSVYALTCRYIDTDHFTGKKVMSSLDFLIYDSGNTISNYPIKMTALATETLRRTGTFPRLMGEIAGRYLEFEAWVRTQLLPSGLFRNSTTADTGDLESTYYGIIAQTNYIDADFGQTLATYYSAADLDLIATALLAYNSTINGSWGVWTAPNPILATYQLQVALDKIGRSWYNFTELNAFLIYWMDRQDTLSDSELLDLYRLIAYNRDHPQNPSFTPIYRTFIPRHEWVVNFLTRSASDTNRLPVLAELYQSPAFVLGVEFPSSLKLAEFATLKVAGVGLVSLVPLGSPRIDGINQTWATADYRYSVSIEALLDPATPYTFSRTVFFTAIGKACSATFTRPLAFPYDVQTTVADGGYFVVVTFLTPAAAYIYGRVELWVNGSQFQPNADICIVGIRETYKQYSFAFPLHWNNTAVELRVYSGLAGINNTLIPIQLNRTITPTATSTTTDTTGLPTTSTTTIPPGTESSTTTNTTAPHSPAPPPIHFTPIIQIAGVLLAMLGGVVVFIPFNRGKGIN
jgi:hypothetical protein